MRDTFTDEQGAIFSADRKRLLRAPNIKRYMIPEGTESIADDAFRGCRRLECVYVPYTCPFESIKTVDWGKIGYTSFWDEPYIPEEENPDDSWYERRQVVKDKHSIMYVNDGKRLLGIYGSFSEREYVVPDGVITICDRAFIHAENYLVLSLPRSVKVIGSDIFGEKGGRIVIRDESTSYPKWS